MNENRIISRGRALALTAALWLAGFLAIGSAKMGGGSESRPQQPPPPPPAQPPPGTVPPGAAAPAQPPPSEAPPAAKSPPPVVAARRPLRAPWVPRIYGTLPGGISHGYYWLLGGTGQCATRIPTTPFRECSINRGRFIGCGARVARQKELPVCVRGLSRRCRTGGDGRVATCGGLFNGWSTTYHRGLFRACCFRGGRLIACTNSDTYICTYKDRERLAARRRREIERRRRELARRLEVRRRPTYRSSSSRGAYYNCDIFNGRVGHCRGWYHGHAVVYHNGSYQRCRIFNGQVSFCSGWYKGTAPVLRGSVWETCDIFNGRVGHCRGWYRGQAAVWK